MRLLNNIYYSLLLRSHEVVCAVILHKYEMFNLFWNWLFLCLVNKHTMIYNNTILLFVLYETYLSKIRGILQS